MRTGTLKTITAAKVSGAAACIALAAAGHAQTSPQPTAPTQTPGSTEELGLSDIVVTANKREENLQRASLAATVIGGSELVSRGISDVTNLQNIAPSVKLTSVRQQAQVYIRGIGSALTASNADPAVAINSNGVYIPSEMSGAAFFDLERVEVLPGPQGTLYGRNAVGGAINTITRRPGSSFGGEAYIEAGNYDTLNVFAAVDVPVSSTFALRIAGSAQRHDPYIRGLNGSGIGSGDTRALRITALYTPTDRTTFFLTAARNRQEGTNNGNQNNPPANGDHWRVPVDARALGLLDDYTTDIVTGQMDHELSDAITATYIGGYTHLSGDQRILLFNNGPATVLTRLEVESQTNELRLAGDTGRLKWIAGLYQYTASAYNAQRVSLPQPTLLVGPFEQDAHGYAAFGQATFSLTDTLRTTGGLRYSYDKKTLSGTSSTLLPTNAVVGAISYANQGSNTRIDFKAGVEFDAAPDSLLYASVQSGYNQGGFSTAVAAPTSQVAVPYSPATLIAYTLGGKNRFFDRTVQFNVEAFYYDYKNYQVSARNLATGQNQIYNAQKAVSYGVQFDTRFAFTPYDRLDASLGLLHAEAKRLVIPPSSDFSGFRLPFSPKVTIVGTYAHRFDLVGGAEIEAEGSVRYIGDVFTAYNHTPGTFQAANTKFDSTLTYRPASKGWSVALYGRNLTNQAVFGQLNGGASPGPAAGLLEAPRTYGVRLATHF